MATFDPAEGPVSALTHFETGSQSLLVYATRKGRIHGWDFRSQHPAFVLEHSVHHGALKHMVTDSKHCWLATGSVRGHISIWDLRYQIVVRSWRHPVASPVHRLLPLRDPRASTLAPELLLVAAGTNEVSAWDIDRRACRRVYRMGALDGDDPTVAESAYRCVEPGAVSDPPTACPFEGHSVRAMVLGPEGSLFTAGTDACVRQWRLDNPADSRVVCGSLANEPRIRFSCVTAIPDTAAASGTPASATAATAMAGADQEQAAATRQSLFVVSEEFWGDKRTPSAPGSSSGPGAGPALPVPALASGSAAPYVGTSVETARSNAHTDAVLDMEIFCVGQRLIATAGREGIVKIWR